MSEAEKRRLLAYRRRRLDARCAGGRRTYYRTEPSGVSATLRYAEEVEVDVMVDASWRPGERATWECPGEGAGWELCAVWYQRRGAWVDILGHLSEDQATELEEQLGKE